MKKIKNDFNEQVYYFETPSRLSTYIVHRPGFKQSSAVYGTPFGGLSLKQRVNGESVDHKSGLAHFLEHKLFEDDKQDVLSQFADMGANANAFTSYEQTMYYFTFNGDVSAPLKLLIDFVSRFDISEASVEKEKGIIVEELKMYEQMPHFRLMNETYRSVFHTYPFIYDILGTEDSINQTTLDDLKRAYALNYSDQRMVLVIVTPAKPELIESLVLEATAGHRVVDTEVLDVFEAEPMHVVHAYREISDHVEATKMSLTYKFENPGGWNQKADFLLGMLLEMNFSELNESYQDWLDVGLISNAFSFGAEVRDGFALLIFMDEGVDPEAFKTLIDRVMADLQVDAERFLQLSKRYYGEMVMSLAKGDSLMISMARAHFDRMPYFEYLSMIRELKIEELLTIREKINTTNSSFLVMKSDK